MIHLGGGLKDLGEPLQLGVHFLFARYADGPLLGGFQEANLCLDPRPFPPTLPLK